MEDRLNKPLLRRKLKVLRAHLSDARRKEAEHALFAAFHATSHQNILSFASFSDEIETALLNLALAQQGRLLLSKVEGASLEIYRVTTPQTDLAPNQWGILEPIPSRCEHISPNTIDLALVPGLGFTSQNHRIGYGKGFYDRFLPHLKCKAIGIGFKEQLLPSFASDPTDIPLDSLSLF